MKNMFTQQESETEITCPDCEKPMYPLKGSNKPIFICSYCGASFDKRSLEKKKLEEQSCNANEDQNLLRNLFSEQFMRKYTDFENFSDFIRDCDLFGDSIENCSKDAMTQLPERKVNRYVKKHTRFSTWDQMFEKAVEVYLKM
jgi:DNA-directed RNA polymerase subunit M/transcription elongation factor TFIIS